MTENQRIAPPAMVQAAPLRCPYCHDEVSLREAKRACDDCMAWHHAECWGERGACASCGARRAPEASPQLPEAALSSASSSPATQLQGELDDGLRSFQVARAGFAALILASVIAALTVDATWWLGAGAGAVFVLTTTADLRHNRRQLEALRGAEASLEEAKARAEPS